MSKNLVTVQLCQAHDGHIKQDTFNGAEHVEVLFAARGNKSANATESSYTFEAAESARDFLLHFHHAQIPFGLIIGERNFEIIRERQDFPLMRVKPLQEIAAFAFRFSPAAMWIARRRWIGPEAFLQNAAIGRLIYVIDN